MGDKLTPDELAEFHDRVTPAESHGRDNGAGPRHVSDEDVGLSAPPQKDAFLDIWLDPVNQLAVQNLSPVERELMKQKLNQAGKEFLANAGGQVAGSAIVPIAGEFVAPAFGKSAAARVAASAAPNAMSEFAKTPVSEPSVVGGMLKAVAKHWGEKALGKTAFDMAGPAAAAIGKDAIPPAMSVLNALSTGGGAGAAQNSASHAQDTPEQRMARILMQGIAQPEMK